MLKLERASRDGMISVIVRDKEYLFTQPFAIAFAIAIAIHLVLIILFHVAPFKIGLNETIFPPIRVEADASLRESAIAEIQPTIPTLRGLPPKPSSTPELLTQPHFLIVRPVEYIKAEATTTIAFNRIERSIYQPEFHPLINSSKCPFVLVISGILSEHALLSNGLEKEKPPAFSEARTTYSVLVEAKSGKIFWFEPKQLASASINQFTENVLRNMRFAIDPHAIAISGEIEFHFNGEVK